MTLHPILVLDHVLDEPLFVAQEPFFQAHRPFQSGQRWRDLPIDPKLAQVMAPRAGSERAYWHQSEAIAELLAPMARPVVVTSRCPVGIAGLEPSIP